MCQKSIIRLLHCKRGNKKRRTSILTQICAHIKWLQAKLIDKSAFCGRPFLLHYSPPIFILKVKNQKRDTNNNNKTPRKINKWINATHAPKTRTISIKLLAISVAFFPIRLCVCIFNLADVYKKKYAVYKWLKESSIPMLYNVM